MGGIACEDPRENRKLGFFLKRIVQNKVLLAFIIVVILFLLGELIVPGFITFNHIMSVLQASFFLGIISLGQSIVVISGKEGIDLSVGAIVTLGVVLGAAIIDGDNSRIIIAVVSAVGLGFFLGLFNGVGVSILGIAPLIMTMAWGIVIEGGILFAIKGHMYGTGSSLLDMLGHGSLQIPIGTDNFLNIPNVMLIWGGIIIITIIVLSRTRAGYVLYSIGENNRAAELMGIRTKLVRVLVYGISGALSCLTGLLLLGYVGSAHLNLGARYVLPSIVAVIIGGIRFGGGAGNYLGAVAGAIFLTTLQSILVTLEISEGGKQVITGIVLVLLLLLYTKREKR
jgi:ribose transport system permease protein